MKKQLLIVALLLSSKAFSQEFTQQNEASIGSSVSMYICDTTTSNYAKLKGSNVVWDFSNLSIPDTTKKSLISVIDPSTTTYKDLYTSANKAIVFENFLTSYYSSTKTERNCLGYFFSNKDMGDVRAVFATDPEITHTYPFAVSSPKKDALKGNLYYTINGSIPTNASATGASTAEVDGLGTLKIDAAKVFKNVLRYHIVDSVNAIVTLPILGTVNATLKRDQYEYYNHAESNLPIYTHSNLKAYVSISKDAVVNQTIVLSKYLVDKNAKPVDTTTTNPTTSLISLDKNTLILYPNPVKSSFYILGDKMNNASITIFDQSGKLVKMVKNTSEVLVDDLETGIYFVDVKTLNDSQVLKFEKE